jgi:hypothetical protein
LWGDVKLNTDLWFVHRSERNNDPVILAMLDVLADTWKPGAGLDAQTAHRSDAHGQRLHIASDPASIEGARFP